MRIPTLAQISKTIAALSVGEVAMAGAGLITGSVQVWAAGAIAAAVAALGVFVAPANAPAPTAAAFPGPATPTGAPGAH